jgi:AraC family transcriptional regulator, transcriptional activator of pobA
VSKLKKIEIPLLSVTNYGLQLSVGSTEWENFRYHYVDTFHINKIEEYIKLSQLKELPLPPHRKEVFDFIFLTKGRVIRSKGLDELAFTTNQFFFLPAYQITAMKSMTAGARGFYCHFNQEIFNQKLFMKELLQQFSFLQFNDDPIVKVDKKTALFSVQLLEKLEWEYKKNRQCSVDLVASILLSLFLEIKIFTQPVKLTGENAANRIAGGYKNLLLKHVFENKKLNFYAKTLSVSPEHLNRSVKAAFGKTAHQYMDEMILLEAKVLLTQSTFNVSEIAYKIGKENPGDFIRFFKSKTGITPKQYRNEV